MYTNERAFYANLGGTAEVTDFCPMCNDIHVTEVFFYAKAAVNSSSLLCTKHFSKILLSIIRI